MYGRFQADNFFVTTITNDQTLVPGVDGVINALEVPNIEPGKLFYVIFRVDDINNRFTLPVYVENNQMKYKGYNVKSQFELKAYDTISLNDLAENFNYLFNNIDDIGTIVKKGGLDILVYGGKIVKGGINVDIADTTITLPDNSSRYIVFDYSDSTLKAVTSLDNLSHYCFAEVSTFGGEVTNIESKKSFNAGEIFSNTFFERNSSTGAIQIKEGSITKDDIDLSTLSTDDIPEGEINKYFTNPESYQTKANMKTNLDNPNNTTYPTTKAVVDAIELAGGGDMMKATYDPNNKRADVFNMDNMTEGTNKSSVIKSTTAPSNPTQGMVWYDTTNNKLKTYNGSSWDIAGGNEGNTKTFYLSDASDLTTAQAAYDWYLAGKNPIIIYDNKIYLVYINYTTKLWFKRFEVTHYTLGVSSGYFSLANQKILTISHTSNIVDGITIDAISDSIAYLDINGNYAVPFIPTSDGQPATKKYVDNTVSSAKATGDTAPSNPVEGQLWYDTTNDVLKVYDGTNWNAVGGGSADINTKTFYLASDQDTTTAQEIYDWYAAGKNPIMVYNDMVFVSSGMDSGSFKMESAITISNNAFNFCTSIFGRHCLFSLNSGSVTGITFADSPLGNYLSTGVDYSQPYTPEYNGSPATKKYVDDKTATISTTAPSNPAEGTLWYDSTNHVLKVYNGSSWVIVGEEGNTKTFKISNTSDLTNAQAALNWYLQGNTPYVLFDDMPQITSGYPVWPFFVPSYTTTSSGETTLYFHCPGYEEETSSTASNPKISIYYIGIKYNTSTQVVTSILQGAAYTKNLGDMYKATYDPNNKNGDAFSMDNMVDGSNNKYTIKSDTTPSNPTEGSMWYSTRLNNSQTKGLKTYDGSTWEKVGYRGKTFFLATLDASTGAEVLNWLYGYKVLTAHSSTPPSTGPADGTATIVYNNKAYIYNKFETASIDWGRTTSFYFINPEVYRSGNDICQDCLKYTMSNASGTGMNYSFTETQITVNVGTGGADYSDFDYESKSGSDITIEDFSTVINNPTSNFTINCGTVIPGLQYIVRINTGSTYTLTLGTGITNPYNEPTTLVASKTTTLIFLATSSNSLELFTSRTA